jgi:M6 family metalloprotease-like protein
MRSILPIALLLCATALPIPAHDLCLTDKAFALAEKDDGPQEFDRVTTGTVLGLNLLLEFPDVPGGLSAFEVDPFLNVPGYRLGENKASVYEYFDEVSQGRLQLKHWSPRAWYTAQHEKAYYAFPDTSGSGGVRELLMEALTALDAQGMNFAQFDANGDGYIDALSALYAGAPSGALGPHAGSLAEFSADGVQSRRYQITPVNGALNVAMYVHEIGHMMFGWRDYYDGDFDSAGIGEYCLMGYGTYPGDPVHPSAYLKDDVGWSDTVLLTSNAVDLPASHPAFTVYRFNHPYNPDEYFMIENRQRTGRDARIPSSGLAIWHIDRNGSSRYNEMTPERHFITSLEQADGRFDLETGIARGDSGDLFGAPNPARFAPDTLPSTHWWDGSESDMTLYDISAQGAEMTFSFAFDPQVLPVEPQYHTWYEADTWPGLGGTFIFRSPATEVTPWTATASEDWVDFYSASEGDAVPSESIEITYDINTVETRTFPYGDYPFEITIALPEEGRFWKRQVVLQVAYSPYGPVTADSNRNWRIDFGELLRVIQFYNTAGYRCAPGTEDGHSPGAGSNHDCVPSSADYNPQDWRVTLSELLRYIQIYNSGAYERSEGTEDGIAPTSDPF